MPSSKNHEIEFRVLSDADLALVRALGGSAHGDYNSYPIEKLEQEMSGTSEKAPPEGRVVFGGFVEGRLAAAGCGLVEDGGIGFISRIYVARTERAKGTGRRLVRHIESYLASQRCRKAYLYFWGPNHRTQRFWIAVGYRRVQAACHTHEDGRGFVVCCERPLQAP